MCDLLRLPLLVVRRNRSSELDAVIRCDTDGDISRSRWHLPLQRLLNL